MSGLRGWCANKSQGDKTTLALFLDGLLLNMKVPQMPEASVIDAIVENIMDSVSSQEQ